MRSSPGPKTGCSARPTGTDGAPLPLRSSPGPKTGCSAVPAGAGPATTGLRSSPGPKTGCSPQATVSNRAVPQVAILTRSEDRVQRGDMRRFQLHREVAILTRSEDRVQRSSSSVSPWRARLRSSPGPKTGCSVPRGDHPVPILRLRSSPGPKTGCSCYCVRAGSPRRRLRSSPGPKTGCSDLAATSAGLLFAVAILTRSEDRVQQLGLPCQVSRSHPRCDPHPVRRPGAAADDLPKCGMAAAS